MIDEHDVVYALKNLSENVSMGCVGTVVFIYEDPDLVYEVEFFYDKNDMVYTSEVLMVFPDDIEKTL